MTEAEEKAIEYFKKSFTSKTPPYWYDDTIENSEIKIKTLLNLIDKLQKENEELRQNYDTAMTEIEELKEQKEIDMYMIEDSISKEIVKRDYIPKDKIRDKLDEIMSYTFTSIEERNQQNYAYDRIRELLEEE